MKLCEKAQCSFQNWYPKFKACSFYAEWLPIPHDVVRYLKEDNMFLPSEATRKDPESDSETSSINWDSGAEDEDEIIQPTFPDFSNAVKEKITALGGSVFVKLNWSAPTDAACMATNFSLKCTNLQDLYLLLKSSDRISKDLSQDYKHSGPKYVLVLKKWKDYHPCCEFRCFVKGNELVAVSQRSKYDFFDTIVLEKIDIVNDIRNFFNLKIRCNFTLTNYVFDVVRFNEKIIKILDFQPLNFNVDTCLFEYEDIENLNFSEDISPEFRFIAEPVGIQPNFDHPFIQLPEDLRNQNNEDFIMYIQNEVNRQNYE